MEAYSKVRRSPAAGFLGGRIDLILISYSLPMSVVTFLP